MMKQYARLTDVDRETIAVAREVTNGLYGRGFPDDKDEYTTMEIDGFHASVAHAVSEDRLPAEYRSLAAILLNKFDRTRSPSIGDSVESCTPAP